MALIIEASSADDEEPKWHYALARMNPFQTTVFENDQKVWSVPRLTESLQSRFDRQGTFFTWKLAP